MVGPLEKKMRLGSSHAMNDSILKERRSLPIYNVKSRLLQEVQKHPTVILIGETGSGKTTQLPQYLHEARLEKNGRIGVTQPRRVAAVTVARRVASEMSTELGQLVGFSVRFEDCTSPCTKLKYLTDGMLLREAMADSLLLKYHIIVLDEVHERTVHTDVLLGVVKAAQRRRAGTSHESLKVVVMSATMDVDRFSCYFNGAPVLYLEGRQYTVKVHHALSPQSDYVHSCLSTVFQIHQEASSEHGILVFLTGQEEIESMTHSIRLISKDLIGKAPPVKVCQLFASLPGFKQLEAFRQVQHGTRKIVLCTNIAETSLTISGITYVVDSGKVKARMYHASTGLEMLKVKPVSQEQAWQRTGRAGRERPGYCYRLYTKEEFNKLSKTTVPEIQRCNLSSVALQLMALGIDMTSFDFMDKPSDESLECAMEQLRLLGALSSVSPPTLSNTGRLMAKFPLDPRFSKIILAAKDLGCIDEIISIVSLLSSESILVTPMNKREEANLARRNFVSSTGDHLTLLSVFKMFNNVQQNKQWCHDNYVNHRNLSYAAQVREQLVKVCEQNNIAATSCGSNLDLPRKCLVHGLFTNVAELQKERDFIAVGSRRPVAIHPSSVLFGQRPKYILYTDIIHTTQSYMHHLSIIDPAWVIEIAPEYARKHRVTAL